MAGSILYLGGSHPQRAAVRALVQAGFAVHVTDRSADPPCAAETPHIHRIDATDTDAVLTLAAQLQRHGDLVGAYGIADYAFASVAAVSSEIGGKTPPADALKTMIDKAATMAALASAGVPVPRTIWTGSQSAFAACPTDRGLDDVDQVIVKPAHDNASAGISRVERADAEGLRAAVAVAARHGDSVVVEEFVAGEIRNLDVLVIDGEVWPISITRRQADSHLDFLPAIQYQFARSNEPELAALSALAANISRALAYSNGPFTVDYIASDAGPKVLEVSPHFHSIAQEIHRGNGNPLLAWCRYLRGDADWKADLEAPAERNGALLMLRAHQTGRLTGFENEALLEKSPAVADHVWLKGKGDPIKSLSARDGLFALAWLTAPSRAGLEAAAANILDNVMPVIDQAPVAA